MSYQKPTKTTHVIFDYGGTVGDSSLIIQVFEEFANDHGKILPGSINKMEISEEDTIEQLIKRFLELTNLDNNMTEFIKEIKELLLNKIITKGFSMVSGVHKLIKHLHENNIPIAIATNGTKDLTEVVLNNTIGLDRNIFSHFTNGADDPEVKNNKPAPDVYLVCAKRFTTPPKSLDRCVIFEDSIRGITGAVNTGMKTVFLDEYKRAKEYYQTIVDKITVIIDSFDNFKPESVGLPPFPGNNLNTLTK